MAQRGSGHAGLRPLSSVLAETGFQAAGFIAGQSCRVCE
jgi:hypothetical protein